MPKTTTVEKANELISEKSPYLLQHAYNPVNWYPWGENAFELARQEDKAIFLSIGYSTCHWCHVMAHESFEDPQTAELINRYFIPIKVDREERPDIDQIYMTVCQMMTGSGGWPLTIFMTPEQKPFYAATYLPKESNYGRMGLMNLLPQIAQLWENKREDLLESADSVITALQNSQQYSKGYEEEVGRNVLDEAYRDLEQSYDEKYGGFSRQPKFPIPHQIIFLLHYWQRTSNKHALEMVENSLLQMRAGGIYDQLGSGFHRYSTDNKWFLPHFEKMLYDQALLIYAYAEAFQATANPVLASTVEEVIAYLERVMLSPAGAFYSAEDADSEGIEGKIYLWDIKEVKAILQKKFPEEEIERFIDFFSITEQGNYYIEGSGEPTGKNILHLANQTELLAKMDSFAEMKKELYAVREERIHPHKDDKILTDWNGLTIAALARSSVILENEHYLTLAIHCVDFIFDKLYKDGLLLHRYRDGESAIKAHLDDYAFLVWGLLELYQAGFDTKYLRQAVDLIQVMIDYFLDKENGGFFFTMKGEELLTRQKEIYDGAQPSGNSVALWDLIKVAHLTGDMRYEKIAREMNSSFGRKIRKSPTAYTMYLVGIDALIGPFYDLVIVGKIGDESSKKLLEGINKSYLPNKVILYKEDDKRNLAKIVDFIADYQQVNNSTTFYLCQDYNCQLPLTDYKKVLDSFVK